MSCCSNGMMRAFQALRSRFESGAALQTTKGRDPYRHRGLFMPASYFFWRVLAARYIGLFFVGAYGVRGGVLAFMVTSSSLG